MDGNPVGLTGRDVVAAILAVGLVLVLLTVVGAVVRGDYVLTADGVVWAAVGALVVTLARYLGDRR